MCGTRLQSRTPRFSGLDAASTEGLDPYEPCAVARSLEPCRNALHTCCNDEAQSSQHTPVVMACDEADTRH